MPLSFTIFIISVIGICTLFSLRFFEYLKGEIKGLTKVREKSDKVLVFLFNKIVKCMAFLITWTKKNGPRIARDFYWSLRRSNVSAWLKRILGRISKVLHDVTVYILKFFGRLRKKLEKIYDRFGE